jgi:hypothetical protein
MSNCIIFALLRWFRRGGYLIVRKSRHGWWPHALWSSDLCTFEEYQPRVPNHHLLIPPPLYDGIVRERKAGGGRRV